VITRGYLPAGSPFRGPAGFTNGEHVTARKMTRKGVQYAVKALVTELGYGHLSVHTRAALGGRKYVTTVIVGPDRVLLLAVSQAMRARWHHDVSWYQDGSVKMVSPVEWTT
jgi:hypothetical protein